MRWMTWRAVSVRPSAQVKHALRFWVNRELAKAFSCFQAGAYSRPLFSST